MAATANGEPPPGRLTLRLPPGAAAPRGLLLRAAGAVLGALPPPRRARVELSLERGARGASASLDPRGSLRLRAPLSLLGEPARLAQAAAREAAPLPASSWLPGPARARPRGAALLFRSALSEAGKEGGRAPLHQGAFIIASALRRAGFGVVWCDLKVSSWTETDLERAVEAARGANLIGLTLYDAYFERARELLAELRRRTDAFIAVGGHMPTSFPLQVFAHLPEADFVARGAGEVTAPALMAALDGRRRGEILDEETLRELASLSGVLYGGPEGLVWADADAVPRPADPDETPLDFGLLEKENVEAGLQLCLSRGCRYACAFCTSPDKGSFRGVSPRRFAQALGEYGRRLLSLYGRWSAVPPAALGLGFYDDDFLSDAPRARAILAVTARSPFFLRFVQAAVNSFFARAAGGRALDGALLDAMPAGLFEPKFGRLEESGPRRHLYLGTESFCDAELARLGKGYTAARVEQLVEELSRRKLRQAHHFIAVNARTTAADLRQSLASAETLGRRHGPYFSLLEPKIPRLRTYPGTASWRRLERDGLLDRVRLRGRLECAEAPELSYPLVAGDVPPDPEAAAYADRLEAAAA